ncbi:sodium- and chloride-dependent betaine transporter-like [Haliotis rubra]|uniref:sodium- and chloride-dependent betaine transporter-like n=1 Tax=Haliotis rubra TaxID=36100 RepID=UPI001EE62DAD|nr:sodium- and chloride-dependent betaine transporter-like [Haliotis rubra]
MSAFSSYYNLYLAWPIYYMVKSCSSVLPWTTCGNSWNTGLCVETVTTAYTTNVTALSDNASDTITTAELWENVTLAHTPAEEFWQYNVQSVSSGLEDVGGVQWHIVGCLFGSIAIVFLCLVRGVKSSGKFWRETAPPVSQPLTLSFFALVDDDILPSSDLPEASSEDGRGVKSAITSKKRSSTSDNSSTHTKKKKRSSSSQKKPYTTRASTRSTGVSSQTTRTFSTEIVPMEEIGLYEETPIPIPEILHKKKTQASAKVTSATLSTQSELPSTLAAGTHEVQRSLDHIATLSDVSSLQSSQTFNPGTFIEQFSQQMMVLMEKRFAQERTLHDGQATYITEEEAYTSKKIQRDVSGLRPSTRSLTCAKVVVYVTALLPYVLLISIFIVTLFQPGALDGIIFYVVPDFAKLLDLQVWIEACLQVFYSLGPGYGSVGTAASYKTFRRPCLRDCLILSIISEGTSIFSGLVTFAVLGSMAQKIGVPIAKVVSTGPGLGFVTYPEALAQLPLPQLWSFLFFLMLLMVGLDSQFLGMEVVITALVDEYPRQLGKRRLLVTGGCCLILFLFGIVFCTQGGPYMFQLVDWYVASLGPMVFCTLECVAVMWIYGAKRFSSDVEMMTGKHLSPAVKVLLAFVTPAILLIVFTLTTISYQAPTYGKYVFPSYANIIGWCFAVMPLLPLPVVMIITVRKHRATGSLKKSVKLALQPDKDWCPANANYKEAHMINQQTQRHTFKDNICDVFK